MENTDRVDVQDLWQEFRPRSAHGMRRRGESKWALREVTFSVAPGKTLGVIGQNGSGKTTLLKSLAGVLMPSRGMVRTLGRVSSLIDLSVGINRDLTGSENIMLGGVLLGMTRAEVRRKFAEIAEFSELAENVLSQPLTSFSMGMALRIAFSVIACSEPDVLLIDEVLAVGDEGFQRKCLNRIVDFSNTGTAIVLTSHNLELVATVADQVMMLKDGSVTTIGPPDESIAFYRDFVGGDGEHAGDP